MNVKRMFGSQGTIFIMIILLVIRSSVKGITLESTLQMIPCYIAFVLMVLVNLTDRIVETIKANKGVTND